MSDIDESAVTRICGIAKGTPSPLATILSAARVITHRPDGTDWPDLMGALNDIYHARSMEDACEAIDNAHEALQGLRECDYDGVHADDY